MLEQAAFLQFRHDMVGDVGETFYFRPESGRLLVSPADETPVPPSDVQPEEMDMALAASRFEAATRLKQKRPSDEELGYVRTEDSFGKILDDLVTKLTGEK